MNYYLSKYVNEPPLLLGCFMFSLFFPLLISTIGKKKPEVTFMLQDEIEDFLRKHIQDAPEECISELAEFLIK